MRKFYILILFLGASFNSALAQEVYQAQTHIQLISEQNTVKVNDTFWVGLHLMMDDGWHVYWQNPGDSGYAPKIQWDVMKGVKPGEIQWPYPERLNVGPLTSYGYEHEVLLLIPMTIESIDPLAKGLNLHARVDWLICKEMCVPGRAELNLSLPIVLNASEITFNSYKDIFDQNRLLIPQSIPSIDSQANLDGQQWILDIHHVSTNQGDIAFYPFRDDVIEHAASQGAHIKNDGYQMNLKVSHLYRNELNSLDGVAVNTAGWDGEGKIKVILIKAPIHLVAQHVSLWIACFFALIGGLILNLMPCVLPVLSIKVLHLVERHPDRGIALRHSMIYALGILVSVWSLAIVLFILKSAGHFAGWGFQFQSPVFVIVVALILLILALNLFGVFEFNTPSISGIAPLKTDYQASFISGIITTVVASPCTAPFMGTALTVAISQPNIVGLGIFTCLGLGLALPFILLSAFPALLAFVPKPGAWMIQLKKFLGFVLLLCVLWLIWVFGIQTGIGDLSKFYKSGNQISWMNFSSAEVSKARAEGKGVFIDFTADWCINCQVNDRLVLQNDQVVKAFKDLGIITFKGDWTKYDPAITQALSSFGRDSIPVYIYYPPGANTPIILPQVITPGIILKYIHKSL